MKSVMYQWFLCNIRRHVAVADQRYGRFHFIEPPITWVTFMTCYITFKLPFIPVLFDELVCFRTFLAKSFLHVSSVGCLKLSILSGKMSIFQEGREVLKYLFTSKSETWNYYSCTIKLIMSNSERDKQASTKDDNNNNKSNDGVPFILHVQ